MRNIDAVILAGGFGTRIRHIIGSVPKPLASVCGEPFLHWLLMSLKKYDIKNVYLLTHYSADLIEKYVLNIVDKNFSISCIRESIPSGTGGAVLDFLNNDKQLTEPFLLLNGDSILVNFDLESAVNKIDHGYDGVIFGVNMENTERFGTLGFNQNMMLTSFEEKKAKKGSGLVNTGVYLFKPKLFIDITSSNRPISLETNIIQKFINDGKKIFVMQIQSSFIDIGTESSLAKAEDFIKKNF
jgi:D-glycero-alpha-D-manno-heptose 1-phosphate guanylyltransferase